MSEEDGINVEFRQIARIESGEVNTSLQMAAAIAKVFGMTLAELFDFEWE
jgi:DNA-binding XRE family transcriptional regulator